MLKTKTLPEEIQNYLHYIHTELNLSPKTITGYGTDLRLFHSFLSHHKTSLCVDRITDGDIRSFITWLTEERSCSPVARARKLSCLKSFFKYLIGSKKYPMVDPTASIFFPKLPQRLPVTLSVEDRDYLLFLPDRTHFSGLQDYTIILLFLNSGLRISELASLTTHSLQDGMIKVFGKGSKEREIPLNQEIKDAWTEFLVMRGEKQTEALFVNEDGNPLSAWSIWSHLRNYFEKIPGKRLSPHKLRHSFACELHNHDVSILDIQALLGHSSISTTQIYTHTNQKRLKKAVDSLDRNRT